MIKNYILGNALGLKLHWIYDHIYIKSLSESQDLFTMAYDPMHFKRSQQAYDSYPNQVLGDTTTQGVIAIRLHQLYVKKKTLTLKDYERLILEMFLKPSYLGYQESFIKHLIKRHIDKSNEILKDDHTVYFIPYVATKNLETALTLASLFNEDHAFDQDLILLDHIMREIKSLGFQGAYEKALKTLDLDPIYHDILKAQSVEEAVSLSGRHCSIRVAMPLVYYLCAHYSLKEALYQNFLVGGSISERGGYITMILGEVEDLPEVLKNIKLTQK